ncbi:D-ribose pyranase [Halanaerobiaceae bacterium Z-7014]|uniref:D-ribose pyranase n=1 Tax=Halonatronomonas betaini TaxID=2778430 RepID=A0A931ASE0_9FIRM|nr:D-ribose pyranase [Halonatronomonas betaini]MBF8435575.1 D-ribose pyranase [Halonatronomonas betaini]
MKKKGIFNHPLAEIVASMGHKDRLTVTDLGFPIPKDAKKVDLAVKENLPDIKTVLDVILSEMQVEKVLLAEEIKTESPELHEYYLELFKGAEIEYIPLWWEMYEETEKAKGVVRTGDVTPYANLVLISGVDGIFY